MVQFFVWEPLFKKFMHIGNARGTTDQDDLANLIFIDALLLSLEQYFLDRSQKLISERLYSNLLKLSASNWLVETILAKAIYIEFSLSDVSASKLNFHEICCLLKVCLLLICNSVTASMRASVYEVLHH